MKTPHLAHNPTSRPYTDLSVVAPMFNEEAGIQSYLNELKEVLDALDRPYEVIVVDDGSVDASIERSLALDWAECKVLGLATNRGHQIALEAGIAVAGGRWVVTMDADGQHPPSAIVEMLAVAESQDLDVVYATRAARDTDSWAKRTAALNYYRWVRFLTGVSIGDRQADFRLISSSVIDELRHVPGDKVLRLLLPAVGYRAATVSYETRDRISGSGRFGVRNQLHLAAASVLNFTAKPLRLVAASGALVSLGALLWLLYVLFVFLSTRTVDGWSSTMAAVLVVGGLTLMGVSVVGEYVARIHDILRSHPRYSARWVSRSIGTNLKPPDAY